MGFRVYLKTHELPSPTILFELFLRLRNVKINFFYTKLILLLKVIALSKLAVELPESTLKLSPRLVQINSFYIVKVLQNIIAHIIFPRKGHRDEVNNFDIFLLDSFSVVRKLDFCIWSHEACSSYKTHQSFTLWHVS